METYDFKLTSQRDVAVYVSTLFTLCRDAHASGHLEACRFLHGRLVGLVPADALAGFLDGLGDVPEPKSAPELKPEPAPSPPIGEPIEQPPLRGRVARVPTQSKSLAW